MDTNGHEWEGRLGNIWFCCELDRKTKANGYFCRCARWARPVGKRANSRCAQRAQLQGGRGWKQEFLEEPPVRCGGASVPSGIECGKGRKEATDFALARRGGDFTDGKLIKNSGKKFRQEY